MDAFLKTVGARVRELRKAAELSQDELAAAAGLTGKYISEIETGQTNPSVRVLRDVAEKGLKTSLAGFFNFSLGRDEGRVLTDEVSRLLASQPPSERRRALRVLRALTADEE